MGASFTLAVILVMGLIVGWRHHFKAVAHRQRITELAAKAEKVRQSQAQPTGSTLVVAAPGMALPDQSSLLLGDSTPAALQSQCPTGAGNIRDRGAAPGQCRLCIG